MVKNLSLLFIIFMFTGCASSQKTIVADSLDAIPVITGSVVDASLFAKGGTLALGSFKAGEGAEADNETDQLSSLMIKGIKDTLLSGNSPFTVSSEASNDTDCVLDGFIDDYGRDPHFSHMKLRKDQVHFAIDGEIWFRGTGEKVLTFQTGCVINLKTQDPKALAYHIGAAIAQFIGSEKVSGV